MGRRDTAESQRPYGIYAHRSLDQEDLTLFGDVQDAIASAAAQVRFRRRPHASAGVSLITSASMRKALRASPELRNLGLEALATKLQASITTGESPITLTVVGTGIIRQVSNYVVAFVKHPNIWNDAKSLSHTVRRLGGVSLDKRVLKPHITFAAFNTTVPEKVLKAVEDNAPASFTVGPAVVDLLCREPDPSQPPCLEDFLEEKETVSQGDRFFLVGEEGIEPSRT